MFTQAVFKVSDPEDPQFVDVPESLESQYRERIQRALRIVKKYGSQAVHVEFRNDPIYGPPRVCDARDPIGSTRVCVVMFSGLMLKAAIQLALNRALSEEPKPKEELQLQVPDTTQAAIVKYKPPVDISVSWRLHPPTLL